MYNIPCVIFAGGKSSRMGEDKSLLSFGGFDTLTEFQFSRLSKIFKTVYISCKDKSKFNFEANFIEDKESDAVFAPTVGFVSVFEKLKEESFFVLSVDVPFVGSKEIQRIIEADMSNTDATIAKTEFGIQPMCGIYHRSLEDNFINMLKKKNHKLGVLLKNNKINFTNFDDEKVFLNLNTQQDYQKALTYNQE